MLRENRTQNSGTIPKDKTTARGLLPPNNARQRQLIAYAGIAGTAQAHAPKSQSRAGLLAFKIPRHVSRHWETKQCSTGVIADMCIKGVASKRTQTLTGAMTMKLRVAVLGKPRCRKRSKQWSTQKMMLEV